MREAVSTSEAAGIPLYAGKLDRKLIDAPSNARECPSAEPDDETLLVRLQACDMEALGLLFRRYSRLTLGIARRVLRDGDEAEDLVQDLFLFLFFKSKMFDPSRGSARSWLMQVTYHRAYDRRRYLTARSFYDRKSANFAEKAALSAINPAIENAEEFFAWQSYLRPAFEQLTENQRQTLTLRFYEGYTLREISKKLGRVIGNVQHDYYRGMDRLRKYAFDNNGGS
jgi:RNA polymerase sigma-70 factor (ECF subfamily)